jgi:transcriptional antiterminator NusG
MNMVFRQRHYVRGEIVGRVDLVRLFGPIEVPVTPARWYVLQVFPGRETRVMKTFRQRNISAWLPMLTTTQDVTKYHHGYETTAEQQVTSPMIRGVLLIPDFEVNAGRWKAVDGVIGLLHIGDCLAWLRPLDVQQLRWIEATGNTPKSKRERKFELGELVRVRTGPFKYFAARVERFDSRHRLKIGVEIFGRITPIEVSETDIEKI